MAIRATSLLNLPVRCFSSCFSAIEYTCTKISRFCSLFFVIGIKEYNWVFYSSWQYFKYYCCPYQLYGLNREISIATDAHLDARRLKHMAKIIILIPGQGASPAYYLPLAESMQKAGIKNVYTVQSPDAVSTDNLKNKIENIKAMCARKGYEQIDVAFVGHSLGTIIGAKYVFRTFAIAPIENVKISLMFSVAGRLKYIRNKFWWFCEPQRREIEETSEAIEQNPEAIDLITISGKDDELVPKESVHITRERNKQHEIEGYGHLGVVFADETHRIITSELLTWLRG